MREGLLILFKDSRLCPIGQSQLRPLLLVPERAGGGAVAVSCPSCGIRQCFYVGLGRCMLLTLLTASMSSPEQRVLWLDREQRAP